MDKGAHFYKTDLQIHSPRDSLWTGQRPGMPEERLTFARCFVAKCRELKIEAVGITDHHDICFIPYFQAAAQEEEGARGEPLWEVFRVQPERQNPVVFPGVEVTLSVPCQCIVLLDADADPTIQSALLEAVGLGNTHPDRELYGPCVTPIELDLVGLARRINSYANGSLRTKYIILPHVGDGGHKTLLRDGFNIHFAQMPCVGGYIEQDWEEHRRKHLFDGADQNYGCKSLGVFQTTDSRREDCADLGKRNTWVKFAAPTAEALRQACLARGSRIRQSQPRLPEIFIQKIEVSDSKFLGTLALELNPQYNALIGGRGTGKTTVLEYIRHAMQDQPVDDSEMSDVIAQKRERIIETVAECGGTIAIHWQKNNVKHVVCLNTGDSRLTLAIDGGAAEEISPEELRKMLPIQAYSQKQLSVVGTRIQELQRFIEQPVQEQLNDCDSRIEEERAVIRTRYALLQECNKKQKQLKAAETQLVSIQRQVGAVRSSLSKLPAVLETALNEQSGRLREKEVIDCVEEDLQNVSLSFEASIQLLSGLPREIPADENSPQKATVDEIVAGARGIVGETRGKLLALIGEWRTKQVTLKKKIRTWRSQHRAHLKRYAEAQDEAKEAREKLMTIENLQNQIAGLQRNMTAVRSDVQMQQQLCTEFNDAWSTWTEAHIARGDLLEKACEGLTQKSAGEIRAELLRGADIDEPIERLKGALSGCNITQERWEDLKRYLERHEASPAKAWMEIMEQLRPLAELEENDITQGGRLPEIPNWTLTDNMRKRIIERFTPQNWLEIALISSCCGNEILY